jgi:hypothetical protein
MLALRGLSILEAFARGLTRDGRSCVLTWKRIVGVGRLNLAAHIFERATNMSHHSHQKKSHDTFSAIPSVEPIVHEAKESSRPAPADKQIPAERQSPAGREAPAKREMPADKIRLRAYEICQARNGGPGDELADWAQAENEAKTGHEVRR